MQISLLITVHGFLFQASNRTVAVGNSLSGNIILAERLNYEDRTRYLVLVQANVSKRICIHKQPILSWVAWVQIDEWGHHV